MQRPRHGTKVWRNPDVDTSPRHRPASGATKPGQDGSSSRAKLAANASPQQRAALEALFTPKVETPAPASPPAKTTKVVLAAPPAPDPRAADRQRLLGRLLAAEGRAGISKAANELLKAGFTFPETQDVHLQLLEHVDEQRVRDALQALDGLLLGELAQRRAVLESRLRRIEEFAEEQETREAAERLRRRVSGRARGVVDA